MATAHTTLTSILAGTLLATGAVCAQNSTNPSANNSTKVTELELRLRDLQTQNANLTKALAQSKQKQKEATQKLNKIRLDLEALKVYPLGNNDERLAQAVANRKILEERLNKVETASRTLSQTIRQQLKDTFFADHGQRAELESAIRTLDESLGIVHKPDPQIDRGSITNSKIISIDKQTGLLVLNSGKQQQLRVGMRFLIRRGKSQIGEAILINTRNNISGALITNTIDPNNTVRPGDIASIKTQPHNQ